MATALDTSWTFAPLVLVSLAAYAGIYLVRWRTARREGGARAAGARHLVLFATGMAILAVALVSPVDRLGEQLMSAHMVQHLLIADLATIALLLGLSRHILRPATRRIQRVEEALGPLASPAMGVVLYVGTMWFWHIPALYDAALTSPVVHALEHTSFAASGFAYWWFLLSPIPARRRLTGIGPVLYMAAGKLLVGAVGVALTFSPDLLYGAYDAPGERWGLTALDDQQVAGLIMALEQTVVMGITLAWLFVRMLGESDRADERAERYA